MAEKAGIPLFDEMMKQKLLKQNIFSFYLTHNPNEQSELLFGGYDESKFVGQKVCHNVIDKLFWSLNLQDIKLNGKSLGLC